jgi:hypothetical protein
MMADEDSARRDRAQSIECSGLSVLFDNTLTVSTAAPPAAAPSPGGVIDLTRSPPAAAAVVNFTAEDGETANAAAWLERCLP